MGTVDGILTSAQTSIYPADSLTIDGPDATSSGASEQSVERNNALLSMFH